MKEGRPRSFYVLAIFFAAYVLFLYGPMIAIYVLSFQGPQGGLTFPMNGVSTFWIAKLFQGTGIVGRGRHGVSPQVQSAKHPVLLGDRKPHRALDHHLARNLA